MRSALFVLAAALPALAAEPPKTAPAKAAVPAAAPDKVQAVFWKVYEAAEDPEFRVLAGPAGYRPLARDPLLEFDPKKNLVGYDCDKMKVVPGDAPALAAACMHGDDKVPVVAFGAATAKWPEALTAFVTAHELVHLLMRHTEKRTAFYDKNFSRWYYEWKTFKGGVTWETEEWKKVAKEFPDLSEARREEIFSERFVERFRSDTPEMTAFEKEQEAQADLLGSHLVQEAGFDPGAGRRFFEILSESGLRETSADGHYDPGWRARELEWFQDRRGYEVRLLSVTTPDPAKKK